jgi:hypothetical protein
VASVVAALDTAITAPTTGGGPPAISVSQGSSTLVVTSNQCTNSDLCGAAAFAANLKSSLAQFA